SPRRRREAIRAFSRLAPLHPAPGRTRCIRPEARRQVRRRPKSFFQQSPASCLPRPPRQLLSAHRLCMMGKLNARGSMSEARPVVTLARALCDEYRAIHGEDVPPTTDRSIDALERAYRAAAAARGQAALCLSGGGIRSAAFSLGVLQALACRGLLARF